LEPLEVGKCERTSGPLLTGAYGLDERLRVRRFRPRRILLISRPLPTSRSPRPPSSLIAPGTRRCYQDCATRHRPSTIFVPGRTPPRWQANWWLWQTRRSTGAPPLSAIGARRGVPRCTTRWSPILSASCPPRRLVLGIPEQGMRKVSLMHRYFLHTNNY
jgi:hypothetical protein